MLNCYEIDANDLNVSAESKLEYDTGEISLTLKDIIRIQAVNGGEIAMVEHKEFLNEWFPDTGCHIFISHSHKDKGLAIAIANKLYKKYGVKSFIDSEFWGFVDKAIYEINSDYSRSVSDEKYLDYDKCMRVASNFYLILSNALTDGIYHSDSFWFINSGNAFDAANESSAGSYSPWLYTELNYTKTVALSPHPKRPSLILESAGLESNNHGWIIKSASRDFSVRFTPEKSHLTKVSNESINKILYDPKGFAQNNEEQIFKNLDQIYSILDLHSSF
ncbi:toll/interleukin-1 receptor domain-containing protein [Enterobacter quasiroggenkampii]|uniref:toll/interleukin-1 receptor domain-containing protein n=1 Tax=Enterobacter quasiroggenkampii TaxID=2497436 RepID=UPI0021D0C244|nr:toll/interleukin-1 receptor domain-containing protein [Enterobacter quasiroggenkampii]MCU6327295.1 toll/interleukin-1 receptor domain-containing protein [Enterobacter quasiroggenkampii]